MTPIIKQIQRLRINQGLTQDDLAEKSGYSLASIQRWERGLYRPRDCALTDMAQALGYDIVLRPIAVAINGE